MPRRSCECHLAPAAYTVTQGDNMKSSMNTLVWEAEPFVPISQSTVSSRSPRALSTSAPNSLERGGGVRARAHACVALGRCVAFGRPKMSVWGHAGRARSAPAKVACISFTTSLFWYLFDVSVSSFLFQTPLHQNSLETLNGNCAPDGASVRSRSVGHPHAHSRSHPNTHPPRPSV